MSAPADSSPPARPVLMRLLVREFEYRRPRLYAGVRIGCGIFNVVLGVALLATIPWAGPLALLGVLPLAGAALIFWTVYRLQQDSVRRVQELERSRTSLVDDSAARLRQIERDLHDGAQAQMVAVTMKLGLAVKKLGGMTDGTGQTDLDRALELVVAAHRGAKEAIAELRDLCRGIHPTVLDQGLGIALTTLAARSDLPVETVIDLPERPSAAIETIAYFCAAELLTNVTKHSGARHATLEAVHVPGLQLRVRVSDDGCGGAQAGTRGGLAGLADRIRTVDGRLQLSSPPGGPSVVTVELPSHA
jgi:signal transduction histidine kinase